MVAVTKDSSSDLDLATELGSLDSSAADGLITSVQIYDKIDPIRGQWDQLEARSHATVYQTRRWAELCLDTIDNRDNCEPFIVGGWQGNNLRFILPMILVKNKVRRLQWIGCSHANIGMGLFDPVFAANASKDMLADIFKSVGRQVPGICIAHLHNQPAEWEAMPNPMMHYPHQISVNNAHYLDLSSGFEALLATGNVKRKRKKFRQQCRLANEQGGYRLVIANSQNEAKTLLETFFSQKADWFERRGVENVFSNSGARNFLNYLAKFYETSEDQSFYVFGLEIGGKTRAVLGAGRQGNHLSGYFSSIAFDDLSHISPGEMLLYLTLEHCCKSGIKSMDLGSGDERYKRSWCTSVLTLHDHLIPLSNSAKPLATYLRVLQFVKRVIRTTPFLWSLIRTGRVRLAYRNRGLQTK